MRDEWQTLARTIAPIAFASITIVALITHLGCATPGERESGGCPAGETCSSMPGFAFDSGEPFLSGYAAIAVGGAAGYRVVELGSNGGAPPSGEEGTSRPFDVATEPASVLSATHTGADVSLTGLAPGTARLRLLEPGTNVLIDSLSLQVAAVAHARLWTAASQIARHDQDVQAILAASRPAFSFELIAADGTFLRDDTIDRSELNLVAPSQGFTSLDVPRAAETSRFALVVVSGIDDLAIVAAPAGALFGNTDGVVDATGGVDYHTAPDDWDTAPFALCAVGMVGLAVVAGVPITLAIDDPRVLAPPGELETDDACMTLAAGEAATTVGTLETDVHFTGLGVTRSVHVRVIVDPMEGEPLVSGAPPRPSAVQLGERAAAMR